MPASSSCRVYFELGSSPPLSAISYDTDYTAATGDILGSSISAGCSPIDSNHDGSFHDDDVQKLLSSQITTTLSFAGPQEIAVCTYLPGPKQAVPTDFVVTPTAAMDQFGGPVVPVPDVHVSRIWCPGTTTTSTTTTTTIPPVASCGDPTGDGRITATDALAVLKAAVGTFSCQLCVCDLDDNGSTTATDALRALKKAVGQPSITLSCPACT